MEFLSSFLTQKVLVSILLFHDGLNSPTRRVSHILLNQNNTQQESPNEIWRNSDPLSLPVTEGTFIGFAVPGTERTVFSKRIKLSPLSERLEAKIHRLFSNFDEFEGSVLEAARTADSSRFTTQMIGPPLIDVTFSKWSPLQHTLCTQNTLTTTTASICAGLNPPIVHLYLLPPQGLTAAQDWLPLPLLALNHHSRLPL